MLCLFVLIAIPFKSNFCDCMSTQRKFKNMATKYKNIKKYATAFTELFNKNNTQDYHFYIFVRNRYKHSHKNISLKKC